MIIKQKESIIILDDDESIHQVWKKRFSESHVDCSIIHYYRPNDLLVLQQENSTRNSIFLIDYEFTGMRKNGLDIIEELNIANKAYLVTSRHDDLNVRSRSERIGLRIIPKTFAVHIPICVFNYNDIKIVDYIFIDDNVDITTAWVLHGLVREKIVASYNSINSFKMELNMYNLKTPIYIDSDLNDVMKGQEFARELYNMGFINIYLCTGYLATDFPHMYWIKGIVGKAPPF